MVDDEQRPFPNFRQLIRRHLQYSPFSLRVITTDLTPPLSSRTVDKNDQGAAINCPQLQANWKLLLGFLSLPLSFQPATDYFYHPVLPRARCRWRYIRSF